MERYYGKKTGNKVVAVSFFIDLHSLKKLDFYIIKKFLGTFFFALLLIIVIVIVFDISEKIDNFIGKTCTLNEIVFDYYLNFIPYFSNLFSSLFIFIAVIFFTSKMASDSEIIAILSSGVSFIRFLVPYFIASLFLALLSLYMINWVIPKSNVKRLEFENKYVNGVVYNMDQNIHKQVLPGVYVYMDNYNTVYDVGYKFAIEKFENGELISKTTSDYIQWDTVLQTWKIMNATTRNYLDGREEIIYNRRIDSLVNMKPEDFSRRHTVVEAMDFKQLNEFIAQETLIGSDRVNQWIIEKHRRFASPFSTFILTLIGVCLSSRKRRGGIGVNIGLGLLLAFSYILFMQVSNVLSTNAGISPVIAVWIPNFLYSVIGVGLYFKASQ